MPSSSVSSVQKQLHQIPELAMKYLIEQHHEILLEMTLSTTSRKFIKMNPSTLMLKF